MKKFLIIVFVLFVIAIAALALVVDDLAGPKIKEIVETKGSAAVQGKVTLERVKLIYWPLSVGLYNLRVKRLEKPQADLEVPVAILSVRLNQILEKRVGLRLEIEKPKALIQIPVTTTADSASAHAAQKTAGTAAFIPPQLPLEVSLNVEVLNGDFKVVQGQQDIDIASLNLGFKFNGFNQPYVIDANTTAMINGSSGKMNFPLKLHLPLTYATNRVQIDAATVDVAGLPLSLKGHGDLTTEEHQWQIAMNLVDLSKLVIPPQFLPPGKWTGGVTSEIAITHKKDQDWALSGETKIDHLRGQDLMLKQNDDEVSGSFDVDADVVFGYYKDWSISKLIFQGQMKDLALTVNGKFSKPQAVPLDAFIDASANDNIITLKEARLNFATLKASAHGTVNTQPGQISQLQVTVPRTQLDGFEKYFPALAGSPVTGVLEVMASLQGDLKRPETLNVSLNPLALENIRASVSWASTDLKKTIKGPIQVSSKSVIVAQGANLKSATVTAQADLSGLDINMGDQLQKRAGALLKLDLQAKQKGKFLSIARSNFQTPAGVMNIKGTIESPQAPKMNLKFQLPQLNLAAISKLVPMLAEWSLAGTATAEATVFGAYDFSLGIEKSPLNVNGKFSAQLPQFIYKTTAAVTAPGAAAPAKPAKADQPESKEPPRGLMPNWPITRSLNLITQLKIERVKFNDLELEGVQWNGRITQGALLGSAQMRKVFSAVVNADKIETNLLQPAANSVVHVSVNGLDVAQAVAWSAPQYKGLVKGSASGVMTMNLSHPSRKDFLDATSVAGSLKIVDGYLSTLQFDQMVNEKLAKVPGLGNAKLVKTNGATADITSKFDFTHSQLNLQAMDVLTPDKNELQCTGFIRTDKTADLTGKVFLTGIAENVRGGNSDGEGRLVVPVHITGNIMSPQLNLAEGTLQHLVAGRASYELERLKKQGQDQVQKEIQKQMDGQKGQLQDDVQKRLQGLFNH